MIRKHYDAPMRVPFSTSGPSRTHQAHKDECDINRIMRRFQKTGVIEHRNTYQGRYGDFLSAPTDYQEALAQVQDAQDMFMSLPSSVRKKFDNDPAEFLDFVGDPANTEAMIELGLAKRGLETAIDVLEDPTPTPEAKAAPAAKNEGEKPE